MSVRRMPTQSARMNASNVPAPHPAAEQLHVAEHERPSVTEAATTVRCMSFVGQPTSPSCAMHPSAPLILSGCGTQTSPAAQFGLVVPVTPEHVVAVCGAPKVVFTVPVQLDGAAPARWGKTATGSGMDKLRLAHTFSGSATFVREPPHAGPCFTSTVPAHEPPCGEQVHEHPPLLAFV